jgi:hypothetical protein
VRAHRFDDQTSAHEPAAWYFTSVPMIQVIPSVIAAAPGILRTPMPDIHWKADMRMAGPAEPSPQPS